MHVTRHRTVTIAIPDAELVEYWRDRDDWRRAESMLNTFDNYVTEVDGARVHFIHERSPEPDARPLIVTHGWPGSVIEFMEIIRPLADPRVHGGDPADAFHVVCPSIPGYALSRPTPRTGLGAAQGGDWGSMIATQLRLVDPGTSQGSTSTWVHLNMVAAPPPPDLDVEHLQEGERGSPAPRTPLGGSTTRPRRPAASSPARGVEVPAGMASFPQEIIRPPRRWEEPRYDLDRRTEIPRGGHFAALWEPESLVGDMRESFRPLRIPAPGGSSA